MDRFGKEIFADIQNQVSDITDEKFDEIEEKSINKNTKEEIKNDK